MYPEFVKFLFLPLPSRIYSFARNFRGKLNETFQETSLLSEAYATHSLTWKGKYSGIYETVLARSYRNDNRRNRPPQPVGRRFFRRQLPNCPRRRGRRSDDRAAGGGDSGDDGGGGVLEVDTVRDARHRGDN